VYNFAKEATLRVLNAQDFTRLLAHGRVVGEGPIALPCRVVVLSNAFLVVNCDESVLLSRESHQVRLLDVLQKANRCVNSLNRLYWAEKSDSRLRAHIQPVGELLTVY